jgi:hypothetical protein
VEGNLSATRDRHEFFESEVPNNTPFAFQKEQVKTYGLCALLCVIGGATLVWVRVTSSLPAKGYRLMLNTTTK